jgi:hypothetical protein
MDDWPEGPAEDRLNQLFMSSLVDREVIWAEIADEISNVVHSRDISGISQAP